MVWELPAICVDLIGSLVYFVIYDAFQIFFKQLTLCKLHNANESQGTVTPFHV